MALEVDEPEILDGSRAWAKSQELFRGVADPNRTRYDVECSWYDTAISEYEGAFCVIQADSALEDLVGDVVLVQHEDKDIFVYCVGGAAIDTPIALFRTAFFRLADLSSDPIAVVAQPTA